VKRSPKGAAPCGRKGKAIEKRNGPGCLVKQPHVSRTTSQAWLQVSLARGLAARRSCKGAAENETAWLAGGGTRRAKPDKIRWITADRAEDGARGFPRLALVSRAAVDRQEQDDDQRPPTTMPRRYAFSATHQGSPSPCPTCSGRRVCLHMHTSRASYCKEPSRWVAISATITPRPGPGAAAAAVSRPWLTGHQQLGNECRELSHSGPLRTCHSLLSGVGNATVSIFRLSPGLDSGTRLDEESQLHLETSWMRQSTWAISSGGPGTVRGRRAGGQEAGTENPNGDGGDGGSGPINSRLARLGFSAWRVPLRSTGVSAPLATGRLPARRCRWRVDGLRHGILPAPHPTSVIHMRPASGCNAMCNVRDCVVVQRGGRIGRTINQ
jgi:hypothetical protein